MYVALCPEFDVASQGSTVEEARANFEALTLFFEAADDEEIQQRGRSGLFVTRFRFLLGKLGLFRVRKFANCLRRMVSLGSAREGTTSICKNDLLERR